MSACNGRLMASNANSRGEASRVCLCEEESGAYGDRRHACMSACNGRLMASNANSRGEASRVCLCEEESGAYGDRRHACRMRRLKRSLRGDYLCFREKKVE